MNKFFKVGVFGIALASLTVAAYAADLSGTWKGKVKIDASKLTHAPKADQQQKMMQGIARAQAMTIVLVLKPDHTFTETPPGRSGTWSVAGNKVSLQMTINGKPEGKADVFTIAKSQKVMSMSAPDPVSGKAGAITVTYSR